MNLRNKRVAKREKKLNRGFSLLPLLFYALFLSIGLFSIFIYTVHLDEMSERINREITKNDREIYNYQREVKNLKIKSENYKRKDYIVAKIHHYNLKLQIPRYNQIITISSKTGLPFNGSRTFAYNY